MAVGRDMAGEVFAGREEGSMMAAYLGSMGGGPD